MAALLAALACGDEAPDGEPAAEARVASASAPDGWSDSQIALLESLSLAALPGVPASPSNRVADDAAAAELGHRLFFDPGLSATGEVSCATCHEPARFFTDGLALSRGMGTTDRNAPTVVGAAWSPWMFWDGRRDSLWAQALAPLESAAEMGATRLGVLRRVAADRAQAVLYEQVFGALPPLEERARFPERAGPFGDRRAREAWTRMAERDRRSVDRAFANLGKAIAAYERQLRPAPARFDRYVAGLRTKQPSRAAPLDEAERRGLRLFVDAERTLCLRCHNGPLLTNQSFHDVGTATGGRAGVPDFGRFLGLQAVLVDPFNCLGAFSDAPPERCGELRFLEKREVGAEMGKFKTPTLRGIARTAPYMHDGRFETLREVVAHYRRPPPRGVRPHELVPIDLSDEEARDLVAFLASFDGGVDADRRWLSAPGTR